MSADLATLDKLIAFIDKQKAVIASAPAEPVSPAPVVAGPPADPLAVRFGVVLRLLECVLLSRLYHMMTSMGL